MDWHAIAAARGLNIPEDDLKKIAPALDALQKAYRPLLRQLEFTTEPAVTFAPILGEVK